MTHVNSLIIVADRGSLRAYRVEPQPERAPRLHAIQQLDLTVARGRTQDGLTDAAGRYGARNAAGPPGATGGTYEQPTLELENDRRAVKQLAEAITDICKQEQPVGWSLAAPKQITTLLLEHVPKEWQAKLVEKVGADLAKVPPTELVTHFESLKGDQRHSA